MKKFSNRFLITLFTIALSYGVSAQMNKKPVVKEGTMDKAVEAIDSAKSGLDSVRGSRESSEADKTDGSGESADNKTDENKDAVVVNPTSSTLFVNSKAAFEISSTDDATKVDFIEYKINDSDYQKYNGPIYIPQEGVTSIAYRAVDRAGNREAAKVLILTVDNTPPVVEIKPIENIFVADETKIANAASTYTITALDKVSGVSKIFYAIDDSEKKEYDGQPIKLTKNGPVTIKATAIDTAGNESNEVTYVINVDNLPPVVKIIESMPLLNVDSKLYAKRGTTFSVKAQDPDSGISKVLVKIDGEPDFTSYADAIGFSTAGEHVIEAKAIDNVGNESAVVTFKVLVDVVPPSTIIKAITTK